MMRRLFGDEAGFTMIELMVAMIILAGGVSAVVATLDNSRKLSGNSEREIIGATLGQREMERISALPYPAIALAAAPTPSSDPLEPTYYMKPCPSAGSTDCYQWDHGTSANTRERVVVDAANADPTPNPVVVQAPGRNGRARVRVSIYRFITWVDDPTCTLASCAGATDYKRVVLAIKVPGGPKNPIIMSTIIRDQAGGVQNPLTDAGVTCTYAGSTVPCVQ